MLVVVGAVLVAFGAGLMSASVGLMVLGVECVAGGYVVAYLRAEADRKVRR